ncbi:MAG: glycogen synthase GlgA [Archangiaceae bacterium]|nr:glycogen synthase GlgA [Archangiaceae bacterium]
MKVLFISSEVAPFSKTGGLADVAGALPKALRQRGVDVLTVTPFWPQVSRAGLQDAGSVTLQFPFGAVPMGVLLKDGFIFLEQPQLFEREAIYGEADDARRFAAFSMGALAAAQRIGFQPDVVHANDWPTGLCMLALARGFSTSSLKTAKTVFTIHNLAYTGSFEKNAMADLGLPWELFSPDGVEFHDHLSFLKAGLVYADALTTVSPTYAREIQTRELGYGLDGLLRKRSASLRGILNGIDIDEWNPDTDKAIAARYTPSTLEGKEACTRALLDKLKLKAPRQGRPPVFGTVGRLAGQKGVELLTGALPGVLDQGALAVVVGTGEDRFVEALKALAHRYPGRLHVHIGFSEALAHQVEAGSDFFVMPSQYEPCGLNQMYSLRYGTVPVVRATGGLDDTVVDLAEPEATGIKFREYSPHALHVALGRAMQLFDDRARFDEVRRRGMAQDFSWGQAAARYERLYAQLMR